MRFCGALWKQSFICLMVITITILVQQHAFKYERIFYSVILILLAIEFCYYCRYYGEDFQKIWGLVYDSV